MDRKDKKNYLSKREQQIMDLLASDDMSAAEIEQQLPDAPTNSTVRSLLAIMVEKGIITRFAQGRSFLYKAKKPKPTAAKEALISVVQRFFDGSVGSTVTALIDSGKPLTDDEIEAIQRLIDSSKENKQ
jgi:predicted transcriptional regulator